MKLRLPRYLVLSLLMAAAWQPAEAAIRHSDVSLNTYVDFATNSGRYVDGATSELLEHIRSRDGGVKISYTGEQQDYILPHGVVSFDSVADMGNATLVGYNYIASVAHNSSRLAPTFTRNDAGVGIEHAQKYQAAEEYTSHVVNDEAVSEGTFVHQIYHGSNDYKVTRLLKVVTDATPARMAGGSGSDYTGEMAYRVGGGAQYLKTPLGTEDVSQQDVYLVGGIAKVSGWSQSQTDDEVRIGSVQGNISWKQGEGVSAATPMPFCGEEGDSGSPYFVWEDGSYQYLMAHRASDKNTTTYGCEAKEWTESVIESDSFVVDMGNVSGKLVISGAEADKDDDGIASSSQGVDFTVSSARGFLRDDKGNLNDKSGSNTYYRAVATGTHTWDTLSGIENTQDWYTYDDSYLNATASVVVQNTAEGKENVAATGLTYAELYLTQNLVFESAADDAAYTVKVTENTDLGAGYLHFAANGHKGVVFGVESDGNSLLNSAGYVVDAGVQVDVSLRNADAGYMREWRKVGEGTLNICGTGGNNEIFLNVGGAGKTLLNQSGGYAAYNVLVNTGATVLIQDTSQIYRDLTFGNGGGVLDMNGKTMEWYTSDGQTRKGCFTINALTEEAVISNSSAEHASLLFKEEGAQRFVGSFVDSEKSSLGITYAGGGTWELNGIRTSLTHADSGLTVENGTVKLAGTHTVHGYGTTHTYDSAGFSTREDDWHYADAAMNVKVKDGATFELESHARLTGTVTVESGGTFIMHEGVQHEMEYIEGGEELESTADIAAYYGHKGDVKLEGTGSLSWQRGSKDVASMKAAATDAVMSGVESTISSETLLRLASAEEKEGSLSGASISLQSGTNLELIGLHLDAASTISAAGMSQVYLQDTCLEFNKDNTSVSFSELDGALTVNLFGELDSQLNLTAGQRVLELESSMLGGALTLSGNNMMLDLRGLAVPLDGLVRISFGDTVRFNIPETMSIAALTDWGQTAGYYAAGQSGYVYFSIPEPAAASLSLLALAALSLRRRRS